MQIVVWSMNRGEEQRNKFVKRLIDGMKQNPEELHIIQDYPVEVSTVEIPTDGLEEDGYKIVVFNNDEMESFLLYVDGYQDL